MDFETLYNELESKNGNNLEVLFKKVKLYNKFIVMFICIIILSFILIFTTHEPIFVFSIILSVVLIIIFSILKNKLPYFNFFRENILKPILKNSINANEYIYNQGITEYEYNKADFNDSYYNRFKSRDYISGELLNQKYELSELILEHESRDSDGDRHTTTVFKGIYLQTKLVKPINFKLQILKNRGEFLNNPKDRVKLDSSEFEGKFDAYSKNKVESMMMLSSTAMNKLVDFANERNISYGICIDRNNLYVRIHMVSFLDSSMFRAIDKEKLFKYHEDLKQLTNIVLYINEMTEEV